MKHTPLYTPKRWTDNDAPLWKQVTIGTVIAVVILSGLYAYILSLASLAARI